MSKLPAIGLDMALANQSVQSNSFSSGTSGSGAARPRRGSNKSQGQPQAHIQVTCADVSFPTPPAGAVRKGSGTFRRGSSASGSSVSLAQSIKETSALSITQSKSPSRASLEAELMQVAFFSPAALKRESEKQRLKNVSAPTKQSISANESSNQKTSKTAIPQIAKTMSLNNIEPIVIGAGSKHSLNKNPSSSGFTDVPSAPSSPSSPRTQAKMTKAHISVSSSLSIANANSRTLGSDASLNNYNSIQAPLAISISKQQTKPNNIKTEETPEAKKSRLKGMLDPFTSKSVTASTTASRSKTNTVIKSESEVSAKKGASGMGIGIIVKKERAATTATAASQSSPTIAENNTLTIPSQFIQAPSSPSLIMSQKVAKKLPPIATKPVSNSKSDLLLVVESTPSPQQQLQGQQIQKPPKIAHPIPESILQTESTDSGSAGSGLDRSWSLRRSNSARGGANSSEGMYNRFKEAMKYVKETYRESISSMRSQTSSFISSTATKELDFGEDPTIHDVPQAPDMKDTNSIGVGSISSQKTAIADMKDTPSQYMEVGRPKPPSDSRETSQASQRTKLTKVSEEREKSSRASSRREESKREESRRDEDKDEFCPTLVRQPSLRDLFQSAKIALTTEPVVEDLTHGQLELIFSKDFAILDERETRILENHINKTSRRISVYATNRIEAIHWDTLSVMVTNFFRFQVVIGEPIIDIKLSKPLVDLMKEETMSLDDKVLNAKRIFSTVPRTDILKIKMNLVHLKRICTALEGFPEGLYAQISALFAPWIISYVASQRGRSIQVKDLFAGIPASNPQTPSLGFRELQTPTFVQLPMGDIIPENSPFAPPKITDPEKLAELEAEKEFEKW
ncbi:UNVERIFIED_CONTAM: hypothetical protein HDU68_008945 [Siphonaria sp. JEL0065]|nr:hypothetical protein HDU68_008945 [Siphonaria sp. JEL0065]